jgi:glycerol-3-phosphate cytidylyltransferase
MIVYTVGTFDLLHVGHLALLEYCATLGNTVAVGVASDRVVNSYKPNVPVIPLDQRAEMLKALRCVDIVRPYHELEYVSGCKALNVDIFVIGEDWDNKPHNIAVESYLKSEGKKIIQVLYNSRTSSTRIKQNTIHQSYIKNIERANGIVIRRNIEPGHELIASRNALKITQYAADSASTSYVCTTATQHPPQILPQ